MVTTSDGSSVANIDSLRKDLEEDQMRADKFVYT